MRPAILGILLAAIALVETGAGEPSSPSMPSASGSPPPADDALVARQVEALAQIALHRSADRRAAVDDGIASTRPEVEAAALRALRAIAAATDPERTRVRELIGGDDETVALEAIRCACAAGDRAAMPALAQALGDARTMLRAHAALVELSGGTDLGFDAGAWKDWCGRRESAAADAVASLRQRLASPDRDVVLAALPSVAALDLDAARKRALVADLRDSADPLVARAAARVWQQLPARPDADASAASADAAREDRPAPSSPPPALPPAAASGSDGRSSGGLLLLCAGGVLVLVGIVGIAVALTKGVGRVTGAFTRVIAVRLRSKQAPKAPADAPSPAGGSGRDA